MDTEFISPQEYAALTKTKLSTVWRWLRTGKLAHLPRRPGVHQYRIPRAALVATTANATMEPGQGSGRVLAFKARAS